MSQSYKHFFNLPPVLLNSVKTNGVVDIFCWLKPVHLTQFEPILGTTIVINKTNIKNYCSVIVVELIFSVAKLRWQKLLCKKNARVLTFCNSLLFCELRDFVKCLFILPYEKHKDRGKKGCFVVVLML